MSQGTAGAAEVFAAALDGNDRAELVGEHTLGRAARQRLVKLPDGSGLLLSNVRYLTPKNGAIHEQGLTPDVEVEQPEVEFGAEPPAGDATLDKAHQPPRREEGGVDSRGYTPESPQTGAAHPAGASPRHGVFLSRAAVEVCYTERSG